MLFARHSEYDTDFFPSRKAMRSSPKFKYYFRKKMSVVEFVLFLVTLKALSASSVFSNFAWLLLLCEQSIIAWSRLIEKNIVALFVQYHYQREVYFERAVQVEHTLHSLSAKNQAKMPCLRELFQVLMKFIIKTFSK